MKLLIEALRIWKPAGKRTLKHESSIQRGAGSNLSTRQIPDEKELTNLLSIREEGSSPMPSLVLEESKEKSETPPELDQSHSDHQLADSSSHHSVSNNQSDNDEDVDSLRSNAGSRQSLLKAMEKE